MRPNIDLPDGLHGNVKYYMKQHDHLDSLDAAYEEILEYGLDAAPYPSQPHDTVLDTDTGYTIATRKPGTGMNESILYADTVFPNDPVVARCKHPDTLHSDDLETLFAGLDDITQTRNYPAVVATLSQVDGEWYTGGPGEVYRQLDRVADRWADHDDWETHRREHVTICGIINDDTKLFIGGQLEPDTGDTGASLRDAWLAILTDGYPVTGESITTYASAVGFPAPEAAYPVDLSSNVVTDPIQTQDGPFTFDTDAIIDTVTYTPDHTASSDEWVSAVAIENPFYSELLEHLTQRTDLPRDLVDVLLPRDTVLVSLLDHHPLDDDEVTGYRVERIRATNVSPVTNGRTGDVWNLTVAARYETDTSSGF